MGSMQKPIESEETLFDKAIERHADWNERQQNGTLLVKSSEREYQESRQGRIKYYLYPENFPDTAVDKWTVFIHDVRRQSGRHRHQGGVLIYVIEGEGYTEVDEEILEWKKGDLLLLPIKKNRVAHQHFNKDTSKGCRWMAFLYRTTQNYAASYLTQLEDSPDFEGSADTVYKKIQDKKLPEWKARVSGDQTPLITHPDQLKTTNLFDQLMLLRDQQRDRFEKSTWLIRGNELPWELNKHGYMQWYLHPGIGYSGVTTNQLYRQKIAPGSRSGLQRHAGDKVFFFMQGEGYTEIDGVKYRWEAEDVINIPLRQGGVTYQHVNTGSEEVVLVSCEPNFVHSIGLDRGAGFEELQPCPEYSQSKDK